eukprot:CAMPEP_0184675198 /NCGR_PEP_ID=MMETSP0308-20130426/87656_1 /TAXON_ID=38269 /ORGANISM="Gloeochaete witrockiana, Strain SAG 46.84" /LENGTH=629 /DNA_ID=CAMNT_0027122881 /DNA_START=157 /DNA_END=2046 /DNA_ORIENTATION=+
MPSVKELVRQKLLEEIIRSVKPANGWKVVVCDAVTLRVISAACRMYDIMEEGVTLVEKIDPTGVQKRQPLPEMEAIYILTPTSKSVDALIEDYKGKPQYGDVHVFFSAKLPEALFNRIKSSAVVNKIKTFKEMNLEFLAYEASDRGSTVLLDNPDPLRFPAAQDPETAPNSMQILFSPQYAGKRDLEVEKDRIALELMTLCATLGEYPHIRFAKGSGLASAIANKLQDKIDFAKKHNILQVTASQPATVLILDRTYDPVAPLLHEFTYQAMCFDLLDIQGGDRYKYVFKNNQGKDAEKEVILGENDQLWPTLRYMHIAETINYVIDQFNDFLKTNKATKLAGGGVKDLAEMSNAVRELPQYRELLNKYSLHLNLAKECMQKFQEQKLERMAAVEQDMSTGEDAEGNPATKGIVSSMLPILSDPSTSIEDKLRLVMIYVCTQGISENERDKLFKAAGFSQRHQQSILNLLNLNVVVSRGVKGGKSVKKKKKSKRKDDVSYDLSRYQPVVKSLVEDIFKDELPVADFPFVKEPSASATSAATDTGTSLRKTTKNPKWAKGASKKQEEPSTGPRVIVFIAGGMSFSETRVCHELANLQKREVIIASTHVWTPMTYIATVAKLSSKADNDDDS